MSLQIPDHAPPCWLVCLFFTDVFQDRSELSFSGQKFQDDDNQDSEFPRFKIRPVPYDEMEKFLEDDPERAGFYQRVMDAVSSGQIARFEPETDEWGETSYKVEALEVDCYQFFLWVQENIKPIPENILPAVRTVGDRKFTNKIWKNQHQSLFPAITPEQFAALRKEPLWDLGSGTMYLFGCRSRSGPEKYPDFISGNRVAERFIKYALDANTAGQLKLIGLVAGGENLDSVFLAKVNPEDLIAWAKTLPLEIPLLISGKLSTIITLPEYITPDMKLLLDAAERFWGQYDLNNPDPNIAPMKKDVKKWLMDEALRRGIADFNDTRAGAIDTIIRCPSSRKGGNSH